MGKEKGSDPLQAWRRKEKERASKAKKKARDEKASEIPAHRRDPAPLVSEIYSLSVLEYEGRLNSDMKQHKKRLIDQFQSIKKARTSAGIETIELIQFDPEAYEESKLKQLQAKRRKIDQSTSAQMANAPEPQDIPPKFTTNRLSLDEKGLPKLPEAPCPTEEELVALGLPAYSPVPYEANDEGEDCESENYNAEQQPHSNDEMISDNYNEDYDE